MASLNDKIHSDGSRVNVDNLTADYRFHIVGGNSTMSMDFEVVLTGNITDYVLTRDDAATLIDVGWRGLGSNKSAMIDGVDVNIPLNMLRDHEPQVYNLVHGTEAAEALSMPLMNADQTLSISMNDWLFFFYPTGMAHPGSTAMAVWVMEPPRISDNTGQATKQHMAITGTTHPAILGEISYEMAISQHVDFAEIGVNHYAYVDIPVPDGVEIIVLSTPKPVVRQENDFWPTMRSLTLVIGIIISAVAFYWPLTLTAIVVISLIILFRAHTKNNRKKNYHQ